MKSGQSVTCMPCKGINWRAQPCLGMYGNDTTHTVLVMCSYKKLPVDVQPGSQILCADGSIVLEVLKCNPDQGTVRCKCTNNATLGYVLSYCC